MRAGVWYSRWDLTSHRVRILNAVDNRQAIVRSEAFKTHVPSLPYICCGLDPLPRRECTSRDCPPGSLFTAFVDIVSGDITIGDLDHSLTDFRGRYTNELTWGPEYTPIAVELTVPVDAPYSVVAISDDADYYSVIYIKGGRSIIAANVRNEDLYGPGSGESKHEHFLVYYNLAEHGAPVDAALPNNPAVPINACSITGYP